jgi:outer membrane protein insertion porin family
MAGSHTKFSYGVRIESVDPDTTIEDVENDIDLGFNDIPEDLQEDIDKTLITGFLFRMVRDSRDLVPYPRSGSLLLVSFQYNSTLLGGDAIYSKLRFDLRKHISVGGWKVLSSRISAGITTSGTPYYNRFYIGGIYSIRGFRELSLSPPSGDDGYWLINEELRVPLIPSSQGVPRLTGILFFDAGQGWRRDTALTSSDIQAAFGYGVSLRLPWLGMLGLNVGVPLTEGRTGENYRVHLLLGFDF